jgi:hypothetical protein
MIDAPQGLPRGPLTVLGVAIVCLFLIMATRLTGIDNYGLLHSFVDEVIYIEPAVTLARSGTLGAPSIAQQLSEKGVGGLDSSYHVTTPVNWVVRTPFVVFFDNASQGKAVADLFILVLLGIAFYFAARCFSNCWIAFYFVCLLLTFRTVGFSSPGRPDLLSAAFGLFAMAAACRNTENFRGFVGAFAAGILCSLSLLAHQFGGVIWTSACLGVIAFSRRFFSRTTLLKSVVWFGIGSSLPLFAYLGYVLSDFDQWRSQFFWLVELKSRLSKDPVLALADVTKHALLRNPVASSLIAAGLVAVFHYASTARKRTALIFLSVLFAGIAWRAVSFEHYNSHYNVHFIALLCLLGSLSLPCLFQWAEDFAKFAPIFIRDSSLQL